MKHQYLVRVNCLFFVITDSSGKPGRCSKFELTNLPYALFILFSGRMKHSLYSIVGGLYWMHMIKLIIAMDNDRKRKLSFYCFALMNRDASAWSDVACSTSTGLFE